MVIAGAALATTEQITVRIGIANPVTRHPVLLAMEAATLEDIGPGRVRFGLGAAEWTINDLGCNAGVRFTPESGHGCCSAKCPLSANSGHRLLPKP